MKVPENKKKGKSQCFKFGINKNLADIFSRENYYKKVLKVF